MARNPEEDRLSPEEREDRERQAADAVLNLRPQPSGETREAAARLESLAGVLKSEAAKKDGQHRQDALNDASAILALLSARPAPVASGGQHSSGETETLRVLLDNLVIAQTLSKDLRQKATDEARSYLYELRHAAPVAETAGEAVAKVVRKGFSTGSISWTKFGQDADLPDETLLYAHPSPTPAADADRVREALSEVRDWLALLAIASVDDVMQGATAIFDLCDATLKSTAAPE